MKRTIYTILATALAFASCAKDNLEPVDGPTGPERTARIEVTSDNGLFVPAEDGTSADLNFKTKGGEVVVAVSTNLDEWTWSVSDDSWLSVSADKHYLTLSAPLNEGDAARTAELTLTAHDANDVTASYVIKVSQNWAGQPEITPSTNSVRFPAFGELASEVKIETNQADLTFECTSQWLLVEKVDGGLKLSVNPNTTTSERTVDLKLKAGVGKDAATDVIRISQDGKAYIDLSTYVAHCDGKGGVNEIAFASNPELDVKIIPAEGDDWYSVLNEDGKIVVTINPAADNKQKKGEFEILVGALENTATATVKVLQIGEDTEELIFEIQTLGDDVIYYNAGVYTTKTNTNIDITVDWGDGSEPESFTKQPAHKYAKAGKYIITTKGTAPAYNLTDTSYGSIENQTWTVHHLNVISWGKLGAESAANVCKSNPYLETIPGDVCGSFANVTDFTNAFSDCYSLKAIPEGLFRYAEKATTFNKTFSCDSSIKSIPEDLFANCTSAKNFTYIFEGLGVGSTALNGRDIVSKGNRIEVPENLFSNCVAAEDFSCVFKDMNITTLPEKLFANNVNAKTFYGLFYGCTELETLPSGLFDNNVSVTTMGQLFKYAKIKTLPAGLFKNLKNCSAIYQMFIEAEIDEIPEGFFEGLSKVTTLSNVFESTKFNKPLKGGMFRGLAKVATLSKAFYNAKITEIPSGLFLGLGTELTSNSNINCTQCFFGCSELTSIPADLFDPISPYVNNFSGCFQGCTGLVSIPDGFANSCVKVANASNMFAGCTSLEKLPSSMLTGSALKLTNCLSMFTGCTSIKEVPDGLFGFITYKNTRSGVNFGSCFSGCTGITKVGANIFPETSNVVNAFGGCTSLTDISEDVFSQCIGYISLSKVFNGCTSLKTIPAGLFAKLVNVDTFDSVFLGCSSLTEIPENLFVNNVKVKKFPSCFSGCSSLKTIPAGLFAKNTLATDFNNVFNGCSSLESIPEGLIATCTKAQVFKNMFKGCVKLTEIPADLFSYSTIATTFDGTFSGCSSLKAIPSDLFAKVPNTISVTFNQCFEYCTSLTTIPVGLFDTTKQAGTFTYTFCGCEGLTGESPFTEVGGNKIHLYERASNSSLGFNSRVKGSYCFSGCEGLSDYDAIPTGKNGWK